MLLPSKVKEYLHKNNKKHELIIKGGTYIANLYATLEIKIHT